MLFSLKRSTKVITYPFLKNVNIKNHVLKALQNYMFHNIKLLQITISLLLHDNNAIPTPLRQNKYITEETQKEPNGTVIQQQYKNNVRLDKISMAPDENLSENRLTDAYSTELPYTQKRLSWLQDS